MKTYDFTLCLFGEKKFRDIKPQNSNTFEMSIGLNLKSQRSLSVLVGRSRGREMSKDFNTVALNQRNRTLKVGDYFTFIEFFLILTFEDSVIEELQKN